MSVSLIGHESQAPLTDCVWFHQCVSHASFCGRRRVGVRVAITARIAVVYFVCFGSKAAVITHRRLRLVCPRWQTSDAFMSALPPITDVIRNRCLQPLLAKTGHNNRAGSTGRYERTDRQWPTIFLIPPILIIPHDALVGEFDQPTLDLLSGVSDRHKIDYA